MNDDWRFKQSPHVEQGGLRSYAGAPLRFETEHGQHVAFGSLCVASNSVQDDLSESQQRSLARLADWIVADIIHSARARRQRERARMLELISQFQKQCGEGADMERLIPDALRQVYPSTTVEIHKTMDGHIALSGGTRFQTSELEQGLWEDSECFDYVIEQRNHEEMVASRAVRIIASQCVSQRTPTFLLVASKDFTQVFDDVDSWFVHMCASQLCQYWQRRELQEALTAKDTFLRGITHQLRTPIHGILGSVELLTEELRLRAILPSTDASSPGLTTDMDQMDPYVYIRTIRTSARELISTVNSLIKLNQWADVAQAERGATLHKINDIETTLLAEVQPLLADDVLTRPSILIRHRMPLHCDMLTVDMRLFLDSIQPLVTNAAQNTAGGVVTVTICVADDMQTMTVDVEDNGRGIAAHDRDRIFGAYEKVDLHTIEAGLGLTLACKSAKLMNGEISIMSSELGQGSTFRAAFSTPMCASSIPRRQSVKEQYPQLPATFFRLQSPSQTSPLGRYFSQYLTENHYSQSEVLDKSLILLDYTSDLARLYSQISNIPAGQVAICLVPECVCCVVDFANEHIQRQNNIVYVQGPFLSSTLDEALAQADTILAEFAAGTSDIRSYAIGSVAIKDETLATPTLDGAQESVQHQHIIFTDLAQSIRRLKIDTGTSRPPLQSSLRSCKPMALLVDDNVINLRLLEMYSKRRDIPYRTAKDGAEAVQLFRNHRMPVEDPLAPQPPIMQPFDLVLMDLQMPICDGVEATRQIRALEVEHGWLRSVVVIVTGQDSPADRSNASDAGSDGFLVKPVGPKALDRWVRQWFPNAEL
jgi:signal transduction histidine kinase/ActR/RegA family two-component response regulator